MNCEETNKVDLVEYLYSSSFRPTKIRGNNYWYLSPLRNEKEASFKIDRSKNVWYDHGAGNGGTVIDFITSYFMCDVQQALRKLLTSGHVAHQQIVETKASNSLSKQQKILTKADTQKVLTNQQLKAGKDLLTEQDTRSPFHLHENSLIHYKDAAETAIQIIAAKKPIADPLLCRYLTQRRIDKKSCRCILL